MKLEALEKQFGKITPNLSNYIEEKSKSEQQLQKFRREMKENGGKMKFKQPTSGSVIITQTL